MQVAKEAGLLGGLVEGGPNTSAPDGSAAMECHPLPWLLPAVMDVSRVLGSSEALPRAQGDCGRGGLLIPTAAAGKALTRLLGMDSDSRPLCWLRMLRELPWRCSVWWLLKCGWLLRAAAALKGDTLSVFTGHSCSCLSLPALPKVGPSSVTARTLLAGGRVDWPSAVPRRVYAGTGTGMRE